MGKLCFKTMCAKKQDTKASARVVDGKLILSLPDAHKPIVWQMDLGQAKASALEVRDNADKTEYALILKTPRGESIEVATFAERELALEGLMAASRALENAQGQIWAGGPVPANDGGHNGFVPALHSASPRSHGAGRWIGIILGVLLIGILALLWSSPVPIPTDGPNVSMAPDSSAAPEDPTSADSNGVPLSADAFLEKQ